MTDKKAATISEYKQRIRRLRLAGAGILLLGTVGGGIVYWLGTRSPDLSGDLSMVGFNKPVARQMGILYGKQGQLIEDLSNDLKQPGTQAIIILVTAALAAGCCFYFARLLDYDAEHADDTDPKHG